MQRDAKDTRAQNQKLQTQLLQLQTEAASAKAEAASATAEIATKDAEIASLKAITSAKDESTKVHALQREIATLKAQRLQTESMQLFALRDESPGTNAPMQLAVGKTQQVAIKELAADESLSEETRESAKLALDEMAAVQVMQSSVQVMHSTVQVMQSKKVALRDRFTSATSLGTCEGVREEMTKYLESLRLLHYADVVIGVAGMDAVSSDLQYLTEENIEEIAGAMTHIEKMRFQTAVQALREGQTDVVEVEAE